MNKLIFTLLVLLSQCFTTVKAQNLNFSGPVSQALANIRSIDKSNWAVFNNAAALVSFESLNIAVSYQARFQLNELSSRSISTVWPNKYGIFSGAVLQSGYTKSLLSRYLVSYSRGFGKSTAAFLQYNYITHHIEGADRSDGSYSCLGLQQSVSKAVQVGVLIINPEQADITYAGSTYSLPTLFNVGLVWTNNDWVKVFVEAEKELEHDPVYKAAVELAIIKRLHIRSGIKGQSIEYTFGAGLAFSNIGVDVGFLYHQQLGLSSGIGISYSFNRSGK